LIYILLLGVLFPDVFFLGKTFFYGDNYYLLVPGKLYLVNQLLNGHFPFWNPLSFSGIPFLADISQSIFYPSTLLFMLFNPATALNLTVISHLVFSGTGIYFLARILKIGLRGSLLAGSIWLLSAQSLASLNNIAMLQSMSYMGWLAAMTVLAIRDHNRLAIWLMPVGISFSILGGHPQPVLYAGLLSFGLGLYFGKSFLKTARTFILWGIVTLLLLFFIIIPFAELSSLSTRMSMSTGDVLQGSTDPAHLIQLMLPNFYSDPGSGIAWGADWSKTRQNGGYIGIITLLTICMAFSQIRRHSLLRYLTIIGLVSFIFSMAKHIPGINQILTLFPWLTYLRSPAGMLMLWVAVGSLIAGKVSDYWPRIHLPLWVSVFLFILLTGIVLSFIWVRWNFLDIWAVTDNAMNGALSDSTFHTVERDRIIFDHLGRQFLILFSLLFVSTLLHLKKHWFLLVLLVWVDLLIAGQSIRFTSDPKIYSYKESQQADWLKQNMTIHDRFLSQSEYVGYTGLTTYMDNVAVRPPFGESRFTMSEQQNFDDLIGRQENLSPNWNLPHYLPTPFSYGTFVLQKTAEYWRTTKQSNTNFLDTVPWQDPRLDQQGIRFITFDSNILSREQILKEMQDFRLSIEGDGYLIFENLQAQSIFGSKAIQALQLNPNEYVLQGEEGLANTIHTAIAHYPGWTCKSNSTTCTIEDNNGFIDLKLDQPTQKVNLTFKPSYWNTISSLSLLTWSGYLIVLMGLFIKQKKLHLVQ